MDGGSVTVNVSVRFTGVLNPQGGTTTGLSAAKLTQTKTFEETLSFGTGSGQANKFVCTVRSLNAGASETLDLSAGTIDDIFDASGALATLKRIIVIQVANLDGTTAASSITVGNAAANATQLWFGADNDTYTIYGTDGLPFIAGDDAGVTIDGTNKNVLITNNDGANKAAYFIFMAGVAP